MRLPDDATFDRPGQRARPASDLVETTCPACGGPARRETDTMDTFVNSLVVFRPLHRAARGDADGDGRGRLLDERRPVHRRHRARDPAPALLALLRAGDAGTGHLPAKAIEPFDALFTQGMVTHETYSTAGAGRPAGLARAVRGGARRLRRAARRRTPVEIGASTKMSKSKKNVVDPDDIIAPLRRRHRALVRAVGQPARPRRRVDRLRRRGGAPAPRPGLAAGPRDLRRRPRPMRRATRGCCGRRIGRSAT